MRDGVHTMTFTSRIGPDDRERPPHAGGWQLLGALGAVDDRGAAIDGMSELVVERGVITTLRRQETAAGHPSDSHGLVVAPLLVNGHDHGRGAGTVLAGIADGPLERWIQSLQVHRGTTTQESLVGDACRMMLSAGVGATVICVNPQSNDTAGEVAAAAVAALNAGIRAAIVYPFADAMGYPYGRPADATGWTSAEVDRQLHSFESLTAAFDDPLIEFQLGPVGPQWVTESTLERIATYARETGRRVHMHLLESRAQRAWADQVYPDGLLAFLARIDLLGPQVCFAHGTQLRSDELSMLAAAGSVLTLNASSNLRLASGVPPILGAQEAGVDLAAGLDGLALGDDGDFWTELRLLRGLGQAQSGQRIGAGQLLEPLLGGGRRALGACAPSELRVGSVADFLLLDVSGYQHLLEEWSLADVLVAMGTPERVREVWVGGYRVFTRTPPAEPPTVGGQR
jgi:cytosine/adenosine deaminase-related metal-dependent hydrolase